MSVPLDESMPGLARSTVRSRTAVVHLPMHETAHAPSLDPVHAAKWPAALVVVSALAAGGLNAAAVGGGQRPGWPGVVASVAFVASWVGYLGTTRPARRHAALRRLNVCWATIIAGSALTASAVGLHLSVLGGQVSEGALAACSFLLAAPLYGLTGLGGGQFPLGLSGLAVACYLGLLAFAVADWRLTTHEPTGG